LDSTLGDLGVQGIPSKHNGFYNWNGKIRLQGGLEHAITADASVVEISQSSAVPHYLLIVHKIESEP